MLHQKQIQHRNVTALKYPPQHQHMITHSPLPLTTPATAHFNCILRPNSGNAMRWDKNFLLLTMERISVITSQKAWILGNPKSCNAHFMTYLRKRAKKKVDVANRRNEYCPIRLWRLGKVIPTMKLPPQLAMLPKAIAIGRGPTWNSSVNIQTWHRSAKKNYATFVNCVNTNINQLRNNLPEPMKYGMGPNPKP